MPVGVSAPSPVAVKPKIVDPPAASVPLYEAFLTVIEPLEPVLTPFHRLEMACPLAIVIFTVQPLTVDEPPLLTVTSPWNPPDQLLTSR